MKIVQIGDAPVSPRRHYSSDEDDNGREDLVTLIGLRSIDKFYGGRAVLRGLEMNVNAGTE